MLNVEWRLTDKIVFVKTEPESKKFCIRNASEKVRKKFNGGSVKSYIREMVGEF